MAFMVLVMCQLFFSLAVRNSSKSIFQIGIFSNKYLVGAIVLGVLLQLFVIGISFMQRAFHLQMLDLGGWLIAISLGLVPLVVNEIVKIFIRVRLKRANDLKE
jgi:Ca2+-transporting ATPase